MLSLGKTGAESVVPRAMNRRGSKGECLPWSEAFSGRVCQCVNDDYRQNITDGSSSVVRSLALEP